MANTKKTENTEAVEEAVKNAEAVESADETAKEEGPKMVKLKLPLTRGEKDDVIVGVNGKTWLIKRGEEVEVPASVFEVLKNSEDMLAVAMEFEEQAKKNAD